MVNAKINSKMLKIVSGIFIIFCIHYYLVYPLVIGTWEIRGLTLFEDRLLSIIVWADIVLTILALYSVTYGFNNRRNWARLYLIGYLAYSTCWAYISIFILRWQVYEHFLYLIFYVFLMVFLLLSDVKNYFLYQDNNDKKQNTHMREYYKENGYILHKRIIDTKGGGTRPLYFFSKGFSEKGAPSLIPDGYTVEHIEKTGFPYLKKKEI